MAPALKLPPGVARQPRGKKLAVGRGGGGKGGKGSGRIPHEAENTLRSKSYGNFIDVLSEGPIHGLVNGWQSIFINDTPLQNPDGSFNFKGVTLSMMGGTPDQGALGGFEQSAASSEISVGSQVKQSTGAVTRTVTGLPITSLRVTVRVPALYQQDKRSGDINPFELTFNIEVRADSGAWQLVVADRIAGKCTAPYQRSYRIPLPAATSTYQVRLTRTSPDYDDDSSKQCQLYWTSYTKIVDWNLSYPDTAYVGVSVDSELFGSQIPARSYEIFGMQLQIPTNYNPWSRTYTGIWDGTFKVEWTNNPAWILYNLLTNTRWGLGRHIAAAQVDKWSLYTIGQYCDELVPNGLGGAEQRFTFNGVINSLDDAYVHLQSIASCFRGMVYYGAGVVTAAQDAPASPKMLLANANVLDGVFGYEGTGLRSRHNAAFVSFIDANSSYQPTIEPVLDDASVAQYGLRKIDVPGVGITSRTQARRIGRWILDSEKHETETVTFKSGLEVAALRPGDLVLIQDRWYTALRMGGRIVTATANSLTIDYPLTVVGGFDNQLYMTLPDGSLVARPITNAPGSTSVLTWTTALTTLPQTDAAWLLHVADATADSGVAAARPFRVLSVQEIDKTTYQVMALAHDSTKYARVEAGIEQEPPAFTALPTGTIAAPINLATEESLYLFAGTARAKLMLSWEHSADARIVGYQVEARKPLWPQMQLVGETSSNSFDIEDITNGTMDVRVRAFDALGRYSQWSTMTGIVTQGLNLAPEDVTGFEVEVIDQTMRLRWLPVREHMISYYRVRYNANPASASWQASVDVVERVDGLSVDIPLRDGAYLIKAVTVAGVESVNAALVINTFGAIMRLNVVETLQQEPTWAGTKVHTAVDSSALTLDILSKVTNPTGTGGTAGTIGSGGAMPTDWAISVPTGCSAVVAFGTESGKSYVQVALTGTTSGANQDLIVYPATAKAGFLQNDKVSGSVQARMSAGSVPTGATFDLLLQAVDSGTTVLSTDVNSATIWGTAADLAAGAVTGDYIIPDATAAKARMGMRMRVPTSGTAVNITLRFALPEFHNVLTEGTYTFSSLDFGAAYSVRLTASIDGAGNTVTDFMGSWATLASVAAMASGDTKNWAAVLEFRYTQVNPASDIWSEWQAFRMTDVEARQIQYRLTIKSLDGLTIPVITALTITEDMPDRVEGINNVSVGTGGLTVTFATPFRVTPSIAVTGQNLATGDYWTISGQSATGFTVQFKNAAGTGIARTMDWIAKGYGRLVT